MTPKMRAHTKRATCSAMALVAFVVLGAPGCGDGPAPPGPPPCEQQCKDATSLRAVREIVKLVYNVTLQGKPVGAHDETTPCVRGGTARVFGTAMSNAIQGSTEVELTYELASCAYVQRDDDVQENYDITVTGRIEQRGTIAVQPSATTALFIKSAKISFQGTVYDPPVPVEERDCTLDVLQNGNRVSGDMCGRTAGFDF